jgi:hypothetical protein
LLQITEAHMSHMRIIIAGVFGPDSSGSPPSKPTSSHSLMTVLKIREKGGEASWLMTGSHVDRSQSQSRLKKFSPTNLANQFVQSALTVSLALAALVALAPICSGPTSRTCNGGHSLDQAHRHKHGRRSEPRGCPLRNQKLD